MLFDIRNEKKAAESLERLTGVNSKIWLDERVRNFNRIDYTDIDKDIERIIEDNNGFFPRLNDIQLVVTHITTSSNGCASIKTNGLVDLKESYNLPTSDLRLFLEDNGIEIRLEEHSLRFKGKEYDISFGKCPRNYEVEEAASWAVGRKFYYDFTVCGSLSINSRDIYLGMVHLRPEILLEIDNLLKTRLQDKWLLTHESYEIVFVVPEYQCVYNGWEENDEYERVMYYLTEAYECICLGPKTTEILCQNNIFISPDQILECNKFEKWK